MVKLAILWHMHQPYYQDLATGEHILPWVRLHAIKDYWGMVAMLREFPGVRVTFNLVPSLLVQIQAFAEERALDRHLQVGLARADHLDPGERAFLVANGFHAPVDRMIRPSLRYGELYEQWQSAGSFSTDDLRDLQVWHKLAWMDPDWLARDRRLVGLVEKQRHYTEEDKAVLRAVELELLKAVIPAYADIAATGQIELSTSPFYHPILPLLCDTDTHLRAHPHSALPRQLFRRPGDAAHQLERAATLHQSLFGSMPRGVWPSEGSLSDEVVGLLTAGGWRWTATDEEMLARSLHRAADADMLYRPYEIGHDGRTLRCLFRDHGLSDLIGFAYQSWEAEAAADDFIGKVRERGRRFDAAQPAGGDGEVATITVILDGENAWEHYPGGGRPFLRALYTRLQDASDIQTVSMAEAAAGPARRLESLFPGSWINGDFYIWAGHADDHRAWGQLAAARDTFDRTAPLVAPERAARAWEALLIAEGSDWFWWYGDDHSSDHDREFDDLFRRNLQNAYRSLGQRAPDSLHVSNISTQPVSGPLRITALATPVVDGVLTHVAEWHGAVSVPLGSGGGTMHRVAGQLVRELRLAADRNTLFLRFDGPDLAGRVATGDLHLALLIDRPRRHRLDLTPGRAPEDPARRQGQTSGSAALPAPPARPAPSAPPASISERPRWAAARMVEVAISFAALRVQAGDRLSFAVLITDPEGHLVEQHPSHQLIDLDIPTRHYAAVNWSV